MGSGSRRKRFSISSLGLASFGLSLVASGSAVAFRQEAFPQGGLVYYAGWVTALAIFSLGATLTGRLTTFRVLGGLKALVFFVGFLAVPRAGHPEAVLFLVLLVEMALFEAFFLNLLVCTALTLGFLGAQLALGYPVETAVSWALTDGVVGISTCFLVFYREKVIDHQEKMARLEEVVNRMSTANYQYQNVASEAADRSQAEERNRITRELHDTIGYTFTNNIMMMEAALSKLQKDPERVRELLQLSKDSAKEGFEKIRQSLYLLRKRSATGQSPVHRIMNLIKVYEAATKVKVTTSFTDLPVQVDEEIENFLYFFIQEILTNAFVHGSATKVKVSAIRSGPDLLVLVVDNGIGASVIKEGIGLIGMRERLAVLGGHLTIQSMGYGFEVKAEFPVERNGNG